MTLFEKPYYLVKIMNKEWADKLLNGEVYMRPLSAFSNLSKRDSDSNNTFRGDTSEGINISFSNGQNSNFFKHIFGNNLSHIIGTGQIAEYLLQEKIYSLYCLEYDENNSTFIAPSEQLINFGNTAVIFFNSLEFLKRICYKLYSEYNESFWIGAKRIRYEVDLTISSEYDEFSKSKLYSWQNEFRIAVDLNEGKADKEAWESMTDFCKISFLNSGGKVNMNAERMPITLQIGDIRDICVIVNTEDLITLNLPYEKFLLKPEILKPIEPPRKPYVTGYKPVFIIG